MDILKESESKTADAVKYFRDQLAGVRGGRATAKLVEDVSVECYGQKMTVKQLGSINVPSPKEIQISVWDKEIAAAVVKAVEASLSVNANLEGNLIRVNLPPLSEERRRELAKIVKKEAEEAKIKIRFLRDEFNKKIVRQFEDKKITEDDKFDLKEKIQKIIDRANGEIEDILNAKITEIEE